MNEGWPCPNHGNPRTSFGITGSRVRTGMAAVLAVACIAGPSLRADAARVENRLGGTVSFVSSSVPATQSQLAALGVVNNAPVSIVFGVEDAALGTPTSAGVTYTDAILDLTVTIGSFQATFDPTGIFNILVVANDLGAGGGVDVYNASGDIDSTGGVLGPNATFSLLLSELGNGAIADDTPGHDLSGFDVGSLAIGGADASFNLTTISISLDLRRQLRPPACPAAQLAAGADLCKAVLDCWSRLASAPSRDPSLTGLGACIGKAEARFIAAFDKASVRASGSPTDQCTSTTSGAQATALLGPGTDPLTTLVLTGSQPTDKDDSKYRSTILKAASKAVKLALKVESANAKKPDEAKRAAKRIKVEAALLKALDRAAARAAKKGVSPDVDPAAVMAEVNAIVDAVRALAGSGA